MGFIEKIKRQGGISNDRMIYFILTSSLFLGVLIFLTNGFNVPNIRNYGGDVVVIIFISHFLRLFKVSNIFSIVLALLIAVILEVYQLFTLNYNSELFIGNTFDIWDFFAYLIGASIVMLLDARLKVL